MAVFELWNAKKFDWLVFHFIQVEESEDFVGCQGDFNQLSHLKLEACAYFVDIFFWILKFDLSLSMGFTRLHKH